MPRPDGGVVELPAAVGHARDGRVDRWLNRRMSRHLTPLLVGTWVRPGHVTIAGTLLAVGGAALVATGGYWVRLCGLMLVQLSSVLDCCDGELARMTSRETRTGEWLDVSCDTVAQLALFGAIGVAAVHDGMPHALVLAAVLAAGTLCSFVCVTWAERTSTRRGAAGRRLDERIDRLVLALSTRDYHVVVLACAVIGRLDWFLWGAAVGSHVFWMAVAVMMRRAAGRSRPVPADEAAGDRRRSP